MESQNSDCNEFEAIQRNATRARVRLGLEQAQRQAGAGEAIRNQDGGIFFGARRMTN